MLNSDRALLEEVSIPKVEVKPVIEDILHMVDSDEEFTKAHVLARNELCWEKMNLFRNNTHPRAISCDLENKRTVYKKHGICSTRTGCSHCLKNVRKTDLNEYGVGIVLYFQFLKYVGIIMFLLTILSVPNILAFQYANPKPF